MLTYMGIMQTSDFHSFFSFYVLSDTVYRLIVILTDDDFYRQTSAFLLFTFLLCIILSNVWRCLLLIETHNNVPRIPRTVSYLPSCNWDANFCNPLLLLFDFCYFLWHWTVLADVDCCCLHTKTIPTVTILSVLCGCVPLCATYLLMYDTEDSMLSQPLNAPVPVCRIAVDYWYVRKSPLVDQLPVRLLLSNSDGYWSPEESDHLNVLAGQAVSKPR